MIICVLRAVILSVEKDLCTSFAALMRHMRFSSNALHCFPDTKKLSFASYL
jgi:hypothetical protein